MSDYINVQKLQKNMDQNMHKKLMPEQALAYQTLDNGGYCKITKNTAYFLGFNNVRVSEENISFTTKDVFEETESDQIQESNHMDLILQGKRISSFMQKMPGQAPMWLRTPIKKVVKRLSKFAIEAQPSELRRAVNTWIE